MIRVGDIARIIENRFPLNFALPGDNCGLQAGSLRQPVKGVLAALDPSPEAIRRAKGRGANLLVTHHPLFYESPRSIDTATLTGAAAAEALAKGVAVYSAHTNLDAAPRGLAWEMARRAGLTERAFFGGGSTKERFKLVVFVPDEAVGKVHRALAAAGAGVVGDYDSCAFTVMGEGTFRPLRGARPAVGRRGKLERVPESRLEMLVEKKDCAAVVAAMKKVHPYEEAAYDLCPLGGAPEGGLGCIGTTGGVALKRLADRLAEVFRTESRLSGRPPRRVDRAAVVPGSGGGYLAEAARQEAQVLITGEVRYHQALEAEHLGVGVIELGHDRSEMPAVDLLAGAVRQGLTGLKAKMKVTTYKRPRAIPCR